MFYFSFQVTQIFLVASHWARKVESHSPLSWVFLAPSTVLPRTLLGETTSCSAVLRITLIFLTVVTCLTMHNNTRKLCNHFCRGLITTGYAQKFMFVNFKPELCKIYARATWETKCYEVAFINNKYQNDLFNYALRKF